MRVLLAATSDPRNRWYLCFVHDVTHLPDVFLGVQVVIANRVGLQSHHTSASTVSATFHPTRSKSNGNLGRHPQWTLSSTMSRSCGVWWSVAVVRSRELAWASLWITRKTPSSIFLLPPDCFHEPAPPTAPKNLRSGADRLYVGTFDCVHRCVGCVGPSTCF